MAVVTFNQASSTVADLPAPLTPSDADLRCLPYMPLDVSRLWKSKAWVRAKQRPELGFYLINLWGAAFFNLPAGSLEDDDEILCDAAMCDPARWAGVKSEVLRGWTKCSDGRLYHQTVADYVAQAWKGRKGYRDRLAAARAAKKEKAAADKSGQAPITPYDVTNTPKPAEEAKPDSMIEPMIELSQVLKVQGTRYKKEEERDSLRESAVASRDSPPAPADANIIPMEKKIVAVRSRASGEVAAAIEAYNVVATKNGLPHASTMLQPARLRKLQLRLRDLGGMDGWKIAMEKLAEAGFIQYGWPGFTFGSILDAEKMTRLMEGAYRHKPKSSSGRHSSADVIAAGQELMDEYAAFVGTKG